MIHRISLSIVIAISWSGICFALNECNPPQNTDFGCVDTSNETGLCEFLFGETSETKSRIACTDPDPVAVSLASRCLKTCKMCCHDPKYNCNDKKPTDSTMDDFCTNVRQLNLCGDGRDDEVTLLLASECPMSCGFCNYQGYGQCANIQSAEACRKLVASCDDPVVGSYVQSICRFTCGDCVRDQHGSASTRSYI